jgi:DNA repair protein RadC
LSVPRGGEVRNDLSFTQYQRAFPEPARNCRWIQIPRPRVRGHQFLTIGTLDTLLVHPREVFRLAIVAASAAIVLMHNPPSGDPTPSECDIKITRDLIRAGQLVKIEVLDHVIIGHPNHSSLRELGYFL